MRASTAAGFFAGGFFAGGFFAGGFFAGGFFAGGFFAGGFFNGGFFAGGFFALPVLIEEALRAADTTVLAACRAGAFEPERASA